VPTLSTSGRDRQLFDELLEPEPALSDFDDVDVLVDPEPEASDVVDDEPPSDDDEPPSDDEDESVVLDGVVDALFLPRLSVLKKPEPLNVTPTGVNTFFTGRTSPLSGWAISVRLSSWKPCWTSMVSPVSTNL
jgi:hypothetical protein